MPEGNGIGEVQKMRDVKRLSGSLLSSMAWLLNTLVEWRKDKCVGFYESVPLR